MSESKERYKIRRKLSWDEDGALEGMPLYLLIMVIIAGLTIAIMYMWIGGIMSTVDLKSIEVSPSSFQEGVATDITIKAYDTNDNLLNGVTIKLEGVNIGTSGILVNVTGKYGNPKGTFVFNDVVADLPPGSTSGDIKVTAKYSGNMEVTKTTSIIVTA